MSKYNGHKNWNHWNVSLWINNHEFYYILASNLCRQFKKEKAAEIMLEMLKSDGITKTPDGAPYSKSSIRSAMIGL